MSAIDTEDALRALHRPPRDRAVRKQLDHLDRPGIRKSRPTSGRSVGTVSESGRLLPVTDPELTVRFQAGARPPAVVLRITVREAHAGQMMRDHTGSGRAESQADMLARYRTERS